MFHVTVYHVPEMSLHVAHVHIEDKALFPEGAKEVFTENDEDLTRAKQKARDEAAKRRLGKVFGI